MPKLKIADIRLAGLAGAVPAGRRGNADDALILGTAEAAKIKASTGIDQRRIASQLCTSDLAEAAAKRLLPALGWAPETVDLVILVTQSPDYLTPASACILQSRLGLSTDCAAFDVSLGCSGYVYGLWLAATLLAAGGTNRALLLVGDTLSRRIGRRDRGTAPLFGDGASATALECAPGAPPIWFELGTDGQGFQHIMIPAGGFRQPQTAATAEETPQKGGSWRSAEQLSMNGPEVFGFTQARVPALITSLLDASGQTIPSLDAVVLHQANRFMLDHLARRLTIPPDKLPISLDLFGNTSGASIPLTMLSRLADRLRQGPMRLLLAGFGVGLSWGGAVLEAGNLVIPDLVELDEPVPSEIQSH